MIMETVRSFVAVELPDELKKRLAALEQQLKSATMTPVKWVDPGSIHLTLKFLGNIDSANVSGIVSALGEAAAGTPPFRLDVSGLGVFPGASRVQVVWVGVGGDVECLARLQQRVDACLKPLGFAPESRRFSPHLTLARVRDRATSSEREALGKLIGGARVESICSFDVDSIHLMKSQLTREGPVYSRLGTVKLESA